MYRKHIAVAVVLLGTAVTPCVAQKKAAILGGIGAAAGAIAEQAQQQIDLDNEIRLARARAAIELDLQRKLAADREARFLRSTQPAQAPTPVVQVDASPSRREMEILDRSYPAWFEHADSTSFKRWMGLQPAETQARFARVQTASELLAMINDHRLSLGMEPVKLLR